MPLAGPGIKKCTKEVTKSIFILWPEVSVYNRSSNKRFPSIFIIMPYQGRRLWLKNKVQKNKKKCLSQAANLYRRKIKSQHILLYLSLPAPQTKIPIIFYFHFPHFRTWSRAARPTGTREKAGTAQSRSWTGKGGALEKQYQLHSPAFFHNLPLWGNAIIFHFISLV